MYQDIKALHTYTDEKRSKSKCSYAVPLSSLFKISQNLARLVEGTLKNIIWVSLAVPSEAAESNALHFLKKQRLSKRKSKGGNSRDKSHFLNLVRRLTGVQQGAWSALKRKRDECKDSSAMRLPSRKGRCLCNYYEWET